MLHRLVAAWQNLPMKVQKFVLVALPFAAILLSGIVALAGNYQRARSEAALARHTEVVGDLQDTLTLMINAETGLRGYLLTRRDEFLSPYDEARHSLSPLLTRLRQTLAGEPSDDVRERKLAHLATVESLAQREMALLADLRARPNDPQDALYPPLTQSKTTMDALRSEIAALYDEDKKLQDERMDDIRKVRRRDYIAVFATLLLGLASRILGAYLFDTGVARRAERLTENLRCYQRGEPMPHPPSGRPDAIGELEQEVAALSAPAVPSPTTPILH